MLNPHNAQAYREKIAAGLLKVVFDASLTESNGVRTVAILNGEVIDVLLTNIAVFAAGSEACDTPTKARKLCDEFARKLQRRISEARRQGTPFNHVELGEPQ